MAEHNEFGKLAEDFVAKKYTEKGYKILERNWFFDHAEIDIIAEKNNDLVIVEVKARNWDAIEPPEKSVGKTKKKLILKATEEYILRNKINKDIRFDVVAVTLTLEGMKTKFFVDAFRAHEI